MKICNWEQLPNNMQTEAVYPYYKRLKEKRISIWLKRGFDVLAALVLLLLLAPVFLIVALAIKLDSKGSVIYLQTRVTQYGRLFKMYKFRTMTPNADRQGLLTVRDDARITRVGHFLRNSRLDEFPQLINILKGDMTFVGTRPEVPKYVEHYSDEMRATLLLPAGVTSEASIMYKSEYALLNGEENIDEAYTKKVLPNKMAYNLASLKDFDITGEIKTMMRTVFAVCGMQYEKDTATQNMH